MSGGLRFRAEATPVIISQAAGTGVIIAASLLVGIQRASIYRAYLAATAASTVQFQDTNNNNISGVFNIAANGFIPFDMGPNGDPLWQAAAGLGIQIVVGGTGPVTGNIWWAPGA